MPSLARHLCAGFDGPAVTDEVRELVRRGVRAFILFARNAGPPAEVAHLCRELKDLTDEPILVCVDQEGGAVQRFTDGFTALPPMREIGRTDEAARATDVGERLARELRPLGIDLDLAPVLDVDSNPANPVIGARALSDDPDVVARLGAALITALQAGGVAACGKHFPGHGDTDQDSHHDLPRVDHGLKRLESIELPPFVAAIRAGVAAIMTAHVVYAALDPGRPATLSPAVIEGLLRCELGYGGVVLTDDLEMDAIAERIEIGAAAVEALAAGADLLLCCHQPARQHRVLDALDEAARTGALEPARLESSRRRLRHLYQRFVAP